LALASSDGIARALLHLGIAPSRWCAASADAVLRVEEITASDGFARVGELCRAVGLGARCDPAAATVTAAMREADTGSFARVNETSGTPIARPSWTELTVISRRLTERALVLASQFGYHYDGHGTPEMREALVDSSNSGREASGASSAGLMPISRQPNQRRQASPLF
jgi:hypothetical protein